MTTKILFLCSGGGGNLRFIYEAVNQGWIPSAEICGVLTDRKCGANDFSSDHDIQNYIVDFCLSKQAKLLDSINEFHPDVVVTTVNKKVSDEIVDAFQGKMINLHYSLLPAFGGVVGSQPVKQALDFGAKFVGATVHYVSKDIDAGAPVIQSVTAVSNDDTDGTLMERLFRSGSICLLTAIKNIERSQSLHELLVDEVEIKGKKSHFNPSVLVPEKVKSEEFWARIKGIEVTN